MKKGDLYIITSDFHKIDIGVVFLGEIKNQQIFLPLLFENNHFDHTERGVMKGKIKTNIVYSGPNFIQRLGIFVIHEINKTPSFLAKYCIENRPFVNLSINFERLDLVGDSDDLSYNVIGGGISLSSDKFLFDKFGIQTIIMDDGNTKSELDLILI